MANPWRAVGVSGAKHQIGSICHSMTESAIKPIARDRVWAAQNLAAAREIVERAEVTNARG